MVKLVTLDNGNILNVCMVVQVMETVNDINGEPGPVDCGGAWLSTGAMHWVRVTKEDKERIVAAMKEVELEQEEKVLLLRGILGQATLQSLSTGSASIVRAGA